SNPFDILESVGRVAHDRTKPVLAVMMATDEFYERVKDAPDLPPVYRFPESAARAMFQLARYAAWVRRPDEPAVADFPVDDGAVAAILERVPEGYLDPAAAFRVLDLYGIPLAR